MVGEMKAGRGQWRSCNAAIHVFFPLNNVISKMDKYPERKFGDSWRLHDKEKND